MYYTMSLHVSEELATFATEHVALRGCGTPVARLQRQRASTTGAAGVCGILRPPRLFERHVLGRVTVWRVRRCV